MQTGLASTEKTSKGKLSTQPLKLSDSSIEYVQQIKAGFSDSDKRFLHIDDDFSVMLQYNDEKTIVNFARTRVIPLVRARESTYLIPILTGTTSEAFLRQAENVPNVILDFKSQEKEGQIEHYARVRVIRGKVADSRWHRLKLTDKGLVKLGE